MACHNHGPVRRTNARPGSGVVHPLPTAPSVFQAHGPVHNSARGETQRKTSRVEFGSIVMNSGFHLNLAAKLSSVWGPFLSSQPSWSQ